MDYATQQLHMQNLPRQRLLDEPRRRQWTSEYFKLDLHVFCASTYAAKPEYPFSPRNAFSTRKH
eukprot:5775137-Lingulodinium_polyedra.AAC.1